MKSYPSYLVGQNKGPQRSTVHKLLHILRQEINDIKGNSDMLLVRREPDNPYDDKAVAIYLRDPDYKLGYLPQKHHWVADALDEGSEVLALIKEIRREGLFSKRYYVDLELIPLRQAKAKKKKAKPKKSRKESEPDAGWPEFHVLARIENSERDILIKNKGIVPSQSMPIVLDATVRAKDAAHAVQTWAKKHRRKLERWWEENDRNDLFDVMAIYQLDAEKNIEETRLVSLSNEELEDAIEDGLASL